MRRAAGTRPVWPGAPSPCSREPLEPETGCGGTSLHLSQGAVSQHVRRLETAGDPVGELELTWYAAPGWTRPPDPLPLVAFDAPCALRSRALETLSEAGVAAVVGAEADQLAGVRAAISAGRGVALMATHGQTPSGVESRDDAEVG